MTSAQLTERIAEGYETIGEAATPQRLVVMDAKVEQDGDKYRVYFNGDTYRSKHKDLTFEAACKRAAAYAAVGYVQKGRYEEV
jgi:hypothetical protein